LDVSRGGVLTPIKVETYASPITFGQRYVNWYAVTFSKLPMLTIRPATIADVALLRTLIRELAEFERELDLCRIEEADLARDGFGTSPKFRALIAHWDGYPAGYALFFNYYSTWAGPGLFLEDLFVRDQFRSRGIGKALLAAVAGIAVQQNCYGLRWEVLDWNEKAIEFYKSLGAKFCDQWRPVLLADQALQRLAEKPCG
jgi:GNAT superfamily N-acetyltransferase